MRLLDAYCGELDGTAIDVPAKPRHERVLRIGVTADIYPVVQNGWHDDSLKKSKKERVGRVTREAMLTRAGQRALGCHDGERCIDERRVGFAERQIYWTVG